MRRSQGKRGLIDCHATRLEDETSVPPSDSPLPLLGINLREQEAERQCVRYGELAQLFRGHLGTSKVAIPDRLVNRPAVTSGFSFHFAACQTRSKVSAMDEVAAVLALLAAASFALAATLWQKAAGSLEGVSFRKPRSFLVLLTQWVWLLGLLAQLVGVALQAAALDRGRVSIIQPLLVTTVVWALPLGYFLTHQAVGTREIVGAGIIVVGLALFASFGDPAAGVDNAPSSDWVASVLVIGTACAALLLFANRGGLSARAALLGTIAGMLYGLSATLMKPVVESWHAEGLGHVIAGLEFWVWAAAGIVGFLFQQLSLSTGRLVPSVATVSVANPVVSVMLGALVLQERLDKDPPWHAVLAIGALCLALFGAVVISSAREKAREVEQTAPDLEPAPV